VCTGGEPLLQLDPLLIAALHDRGFEIAVETNGTIAPPAGLDWVCVSPKAGAGLVVERGDELKIVVPQTGLDPLDFTHLAFRWFSVQPMDGPDRTRNTEIAMEFCRTHPQWQLSLQTHKLVGYR
jgi:organic radical activating enzyme